MFLPAPERTVFLCLKKEKTTILSFSGLLRQEKIACLKKVIFPTMTSTGSRAFSGRGHGHLKPQGSRNRNRKNADKETMKKGSAPKNAERRAKKMLKKIISVLLSITVILSCIATSAFAEDGAVAAKVKEYLVAPSQYTNNPMFGKNIENTLSGKAATTSLGNFGGYVIYEFDNKIENSDTHRYGVDFMISGNAFNAAATTQEPGQVWVSQDGSIWYALAGSEHYENDTDWNYSVTYNNTGTSPSTYTDSHGESGNACTRSPYPKKDMYPTVDFDETSLTLSGVLLKKNLTPSTANGIATSFGYVDALKWKLSDTPSNPYVENPTVNGIDGQFDISWAVDNNGIPVSLDWIKYVKVQTATFIDGGAFGEKSTEINGVRLAQNEEFDSKTVDTQITVNGQTAVFDSNNFCKLDNLDKGVDISVSADEANIYINNERTERRIYSAAPDKGLVRVIVQSGDGAPQIYTLDVSSALPETELKISDSSLTLTRLDSAQLKANLSSVTWSSSEEDIVSIDKDGKLFAVSEGTATITAVSAKGQTAECTVTVLPRADEETVSVTFSASDSSIIIAPETIEVTSGTAKAYGYNVAAFDHNRKEVHGVTVFDVIVAEHKKIYGDAFTRSTATDYLVMNSSFIMKSFGRNTSTCGFLVNGAMPNDGIYNENYGSYTGYACDTATVVDGDVISYYFYQDTRYYSDMFASFDSDSYTISAGKKLKVNIKGYSPFEHGLESPEVIKEKYLTNMKDVDIYILNNGELQKVSTTDKRGNAKIKLSEEGEYTLVAIRAASDDQAPTIAAYSKVTVTAKTELWIVRVFKTVYKFVTDIINKIFGGMC